MAIVEVLQSHALLHPIRMSVVLALGADELTTREIHARLPEVAQASLYRAVARLVEAGMIEVASQRRKGGAVERVYRAAAGSVSGDAPLASAALAKAEAVAAALKADVARFAAAANEERVAPVLHREVAAVPRERLAALESQVAAFVDAVKVPVGTQGAIQVAITVALVALNAPDPGESD